MILKSVTNIAENVRTILKDIEESNGEKVYENVKPYYKVVS